MSLSKQQREVLKNYIANYLSRTERQLVTLYYYEEKTIPEIALVLDLPASKVSAIRSAVLGRLKAVMRDM